MPVSENRSLSYLGAPPVGRRLFFVNAQATSEELAGAVFRVAEMGAGFAQFAFSFRQ